MAPCFGAKKMLRTEPIDPLAEIAVNIAKNQANSFLRRAQIANTGSNLPIGKVTFCYMGLLRLLSGPSHLKGPLPPM